MREDTGRWRSPLGLGRRLTRVACARRLPVRRTQTGSDLWVRTIGDTGRIAVMSDPLAYLLTWTCYGTWLHGDVRGSVESHQNGPGEPFVKSNASWVAEAHRKLRSPVVRLDQRGRRIVANTIQSHCAHRGWQLRACNVRTNHVHVVVSCPDVLPDRVLTELKAWSTRRLREAGLFDREARVWTRHGSTRYLWKEEGLNAAMEYVLERQDDGKGDNDRRSP
ncbi:MAG: transposase [Gammaproteobacteria bacterium]